MRIYTRRGDHGETDLFFGGRVGKDDLRMEILGTLDELNSALGVVRSMLPEASDVEPLLKGFQSQLLKLGGEFACVDPTAKQMVCFCEADVAFLEERIDAMTAELPPLTELICPGGPPAAAFCHMARTICRRLERRVVELQHQGATVPDVTFAWINRFACVLTCRRCYLPQPQPVSMTPSLIRIGSPM